jgi:uncharacterized protein YjbJ (UPF0337 family)
MNKEQMSGQLDQLKGKIKESWGKLTDDDMALYEGQSDKFYGRLKELYGIAREGADKRMREIEKSVHEGQKNAAQAAGIAVAEAEAKRKNVA